MTSAATAYNAAPNAEKLSKYIADVQIVAGPPWTVTVFILAIAGNGLSLSLNNSTITYSPNVNGTMPTPASVGAVDWACASDVSTTASGRGFGNITLGTLPSRFAPTECR